MPPPEQKKNRLAGESQSDYDLRMEIERAEKQGEQITEENNSPIGRSVMQKVENPTLAERLAPGNPRAQQGLRQATDTFTSGLGGALSGGPMGAAIGAGTSLLAGMMEPNQAQEIGSLTNLSNMLTPGVGKFAKASGPISAAIAKHPFLGHGVVGAIEGGLQGAAQGQDAQKDPITGGLFGAAIQGPLSGLFGRLQSSGRELPARLSGEIRNNLAAEAEKMGGRLPDSVDQGALLDTLAGKFRKVNPFLRTPAETAQHELTLKALDAEKSAVAKTIPGLQIAAKTADTKLNSAEKLAALKTAELEEAVNIERARSKDFLRSYPGMVAKVDQEVSALGTPHARSLQGGEQAYQDALSRRQQLQTEFDRAIEDTSSEAALRKKVTMKGELLNSDFHKAVFAASQNKDAASSAVKNAQSRVNSLAVKAQSLVTTESARQKSLDDIFHAIQMDPRLFTDDARQAIRVLASDPKFSPESLFQKTLMSGSGSEMMTRGLMDAIGNDNATKTALRTRFTQHMFDHFQFGRDENVYGKTFDAKIVDFLQKLDPRAVNNFYGNADAHKNITALMERLRKSYSETDDHMLGLKLAVGGAGAAAYAGSHMVGNANSGESTPGLLFKIAVGAGVGGVVSRMISWRHVTNNLLQADGLRAKALQKFLEAKDPTKIPAATARLALKTLLANSESAPE